MAKDVASRVSGDEALEGEVCERAERAAARIASIHERWSTGSAVEENVGAAPAGDAAPEELAQAPEGGAQAPDADSVSVTPILGIATAEGDDAAPRPRFKTLMGVPRTDPEIDDLAGLEPVVARPRDTTRLERPAQRTTAPLEVSSQPSPLAAGEAAGHAPSRDEPSLAATSWPWDRNAPLPASPSRAVAPQWSALVESSLDVSAEVAAMRTARTRRTWLIGLLAIIGALALFSVAAPRERTLALRWLRREYQTRIDPSLDAVTDRARALSPARGVVDPAAEVPAASGRLATAAIGAELARAAESAATTHTESVAPPAAGSIGGATSETAAARAEVASTNSKGPPTGSAATPISSSATTLIAASGDDPSTAENRATSPTARPPRAATGRNTDERSAERQRTERARPERQRAERQRTERQSGAETVALRDTRVASAIEEKNRAQVAAPRKRQRPAPAASGTTKPRATRQNSPRKDTGGGIIRETPF